MLAEGRPLVSPPIQLIVGVGMIVGFGVLVATIRRARQPQYSRAERWYLNYELTGAALFFFLGVAVAVSGLLRLFF